MILSTAYNAYCRNVRQQPIETEVGPDIHINLQKADGTNIVKRISTLEFQIMFPEGEDELSGQDIPRINFLADYLQNKPTLVVRIDGHADTNGTDEYNNVLSRERASTIKKSLVKRGIDETRIETFFHGASFAMTPEANHIYERRVDIEVYETISNQVVDVR